MHKAFVETLFLHYKHSPSVKTILSPIKYLPKAYYLKDRCLSSYSQYDKNASASSSSGMRMTVRREREIDGEEN